MSVNEDNQIIKQFANSAREIPNFKSKNDKLFNPKNEYFQETLQKEDQIRPKGFRQSLPRNLKNPNFQSNRFSARHSSRPSSSLNKTKNTLSNQ
jgi:hypothetical protein